VDVPEDPFAPETSHLQVLSSHAPSLAYTSERDFSDWRQEVAAKLREVVGSAPDTVPLDIRREETVERDSFLESRFRFTSERSADVPCHLLTPKTGSPPYPVVICLQGHTSGMHISLGRPKSEADERMVADGDRDFALQAIREGYAALVIEQRCFGERKDSRPQSVRHVTNGCHHASMVALLLGRTMRGR